MATKWFYGFEYIILNITTNIPLSTIEKKARYPMADFLPSSWQVLQFYLGVCRSCFFIGAPRKSLVRDYRGYRRSEHKSEIPLYRTNLLSCPERRSFIAQQPCIRRDVLRQLPRSFDTTALFFFSS